MEAAKGIHRKASPGAGPGSGGPSSAENAVNGLGSGRAMESGVRKSMESRFGHDFSSVRIHDDTKAANAAESISARAFTHGTDIAFGQREYASTTLPGQQLLAHELTHVVQQQTTGVAAWIGRPANKPTEHSRPTLPYSRPGHLRGSGRRPFTGCAGRQCFQCAFLPDRLSKTKRSGMRFWQRCGAFARPAGLVGLDADEICPHPLRQRSTKQPRDLVIGSCSIRNTLGRRRALSKSFRSGRSEERSRARSAAARRLRS